MRSHWLLRVRGLRVHAHLHACTHACQSLAGYRSLSARPRAGRRAQLQKGRPVNSTPLARSPPVPHAAGRPPAALTAQLFRLRLCVWQLYQTCVVWWGGVVCTVQQHAMCVGHPRLHGLHAASQHTGMTLRLFYGGDLKPALCCPACGRHGHGRHHVLQSCTAAGAGLRL